MSGAVVLVDGAGVKVGGFGELAYEVGFPDPGPLLVGEDYGDEVTCLLEVVNEGMDVGR